jgi:very-short-patch-repair endonuclease
MATPKRISHSHGFAGFPHSPLQHGEGSGVRLKGLAMEKPPHFHAPPELWHKLKPLARQMRHRPTPAEDKLWQYLRNRQLAGVKFRRQYALERFIVDFVCLERHLIIEVDGDIHQLQEEYDRIRQEFLEMQGFRVLRFRNETVLTDIEFVAMSILADLDAEG